MEKPGDKYAEMVAKWITDWKEYMDEREEAYDGEAYAVLGSDTFFLTAVLLAIYEQLDAIRAALTERG